MMDLRRAGALGCALLCASPALAHTGIGDTHGFASGFAHPLGGLDHTLAMVAVGWLAARIGGRALWCVPGCFLAAMAAGGVLASLGAGLPAAEVGIALSCVAFGVALAWPRDLPMVGIAALVAAFGLFHGHAHGAEMPADASGVAYGAGFLVATALLHLAGIALGLAAGRLPGRRAAAATAGFATALAGLVLLVG